ncbi:Protein ROOT PRIMORDIUM DEFECTIVE 1 [Camellia lanceoleosa]|uniref:Protein ROOT PRIMORDIUM DEFECTIVE 1 n=1 Tax=Camellia lanceoleosa TaxID=1840588 RepID=A0ACC0FQW1_9ERIC|nr:Protein ROOT PRIMORDIUM DEFECTIVE 1 [Camellia lanceoleosa]
MRTLQSFMHTILEIKPSSHSSPSSTPFPFGPFNSTTQRRWKKKPSDTAQTRLESRTRDLKLDKLTTHLHKLTLVLNLHRLISPRKRGPFVSVQFMSRWKNIVGLNIPVGTFLRKYPHVFEVFTHPIKRNVCCKIRKKMSDLIQEEEGFIRVSESENVGRIKRLLMMSVNGTLHIHALRLIRRELGLPQDFQESIIGKYTNEFWLVDLEIVGLVDRDRELGFVGEVEKWREKEFREKWLSEFETKGVKVQYLHGGIERFEKRAVGILHELLWLTVEKKVEVERLVHFRKDLGIEVNLRELILKHPGIFYISTKGNAQTVFLREAYGKGCLMEPNPISVVRRKMLDLILLGCRNTIALRTRKETRNENNNVVCNEIEGVTTNGDWVIPFLDGFNDKKTDDELSEIGGLSKEELNGLS